MLEKGDKKMINYKNFDYSKLDPVSMKTINHLSIFSKYRDLMMRFFKNTRLSSDVKLAFLEQHSMKLGARTFNKLQMAKLDYNYSVECIPYIGGAAAFMFFIMFAYIRPLNAKLYKEVLMSTVMGMGIGFLWS